MNTISSIVTSKANRHIFAEEVKKQRDQFIVSNGNLVGKINTPFGRTNQYIYLPH